MYVYKRTLFANIIFFGS